MASTIRACSAARRSWSRLPYATSWVSACLNVYSSSGNRLTSRRGTPRPGAAAGRARSSAPAARRWPRSSANGHVLADHGRRLEQPLVLRRRGGRCGRPGPPGPWPAPGWPRSGVASRYAPRSPDERAGLDQRADALLEEERVALRPLDQQLLEGLQPRRRRPSSARRAAPRRSRAAAGRSGAACSSSCSPQRVRVLRTVVDEQQHAARSAGSRPGRRGAPGSRRRSSADPRTTSSSGCTWLSRSSRRLTRVERRAAAAGAGRARPTADPRPARRAATGAPARPGSSASSSVSSLPIDLLAHRARGRRGLDLEVAPGAGR